MLFILTKLFFYYGIIRADLVLISPVESVTENRIKYVIKCHISESDVWSSGTDLNVTT